jgi:hypothetical protein
MVTAKTSNLEVGNLSILAIRDFESKRLSSIFRLRIKTGFAISG